MGPRPPGPACGTSFRKSDTLFLDSLEPPVVQAAGDVDQVVAGPDLKTQFPGQATGNLFPVGPAHEVGDGRAVGDVPVLAAENDLADLLQLRPELADFLLGGEAHRSARAGATDGFLDLAADRSEEHTSELQSLRHLVCR